MADFSRKFPHAEEVISARGRGIFTLCIFDWFPDRVCKVLKYHVARLYSSVPINHLAHGPAIRLLEGESYYPARLWWCTTSKPTLDLKLPLSDRPPHENSAIAYKKWNGDHPKKVCSSPFRCWREPFVKITTNVPISLLIYFIEPCCRLTSEKNENDRSSKYKKSEEVGRHEHENAAACINQRSMKK